MTPSRCLAVILWLCLLPTLTLAQPHNQLTDRERADGWILLFDGHDLEGWAPRGDARWDVVDGAIDYRAGSGSGHLATLRDFDNFELKVDFWVDDVANSGVFLRCPAEGPISATNSYEVNIYDAHDTWPTASVNEVAVRRGETRSAGQWNTFEITLDGDHIVVRLNGRVTVDVRDTRETNGPIALQQFTGKGDVRFRNIKLKPGPAR